MKDRCRKSRIDRRQFIRMRNGSLIVVLGTVRCEIARGFTPPGLTEYIRMLDLDLPVNSLFDFMAPKVSASNPWIGRTSC